MRNQLPAESESAAVRHLLVVANQPLWGHELASVLRAPGADVKLDIIAPVLCSRTRYLTSDYDEERAAARGRLEESLAWAVAHGFVATGLVGDPDPVSAIRDELRLFEAEGVVVVTSPADHRSWLENRIVNCLQNQLGGFLTQVVLHRDVRRAADPPRRLATPARALAASS
jgi:hypothetical protein